VVSPLTTYLNTRYLYLGTGVSSRFDGGGLGPRQIKMCVWAATLCVWSVCSPTLPGCWSHFPLWRRGVLALGDIGICVSGQHHHREHPSAGDSAINGRASPKGPLARRTKLRIGKQLLKLLRTHRSANWWWIWCAGHRRRIAEIVSAELRQMRCLQGPIHPAPGIVRWKVLYLNGPCSIIAVNSYW